jgi:hypothetical protein
MFRPHSAILITFWNCYTSLVLKLKYSKLFATANHLMYNRFMICVIVNHEYIIYYRKHGHRKKVAQVNMTNELLEQMYNILKSKRRKRNNTLIF